MYDSDSTLVLNDVIEVVGFLSVDPTLSAATVSSTEEIGKDEETHLHNQPWSLVPRLHAVSVRKLHHNNPLLHPTLCNTGIPHTHSCIVMTSMTRKFNFFLF